MIVFILGGQGFVGSAFVRAAAKRHKVTAITRQNYDRFRGQSCDLLINANGNSKKFLADRDPIGEFDASVASVLRSLLDFPCGRYVYLSTIDVYPRVDCPRWNCESATVDPARLSRYGLHKFLAEQLVRKYAGHWLICRLGGMVGEGLWKNAVYDILHGQPLRIHLQSEYQYLSTDEVARIVFTLLRKQEKNDVINVCGDGCISVGEISKLAGTAGRISVSPDARRERYEVSIKKLKCLTHVPKTADTIRKFMARRA